MVSFLVDLCDFSPNGLYLACVIQTDKRILVRHCDRKKATYGCENSITVNSRLSKEFGSEIKLPVEHKFNLEKNGSPITDISWSPDSLFIGASCKKYSVLSVYSLVDRNWKCKVSFGTLEEKGGIGLERFWWGRDARHLLCLSEDFVYLTVWSIKKKSFQYIKDIAKISDCGHSSSPDGSLLAIAHVDQTYKFYIGIYSSKTWEKTGSFYVASRDLAGISWCPIGFSNESGRKGKGTDSGINFIVCWDSALFSNVYIYHALSGNLIKHYSPYGMSTGFDSVNWTSYGHLICTAYNKNEVHVLNGLTFGSLIHDILAPSYSDKSCKSDEDKNGVKIFCENVGGTGSKYRVVSKWPTMDMELSTRSSFPNENNHKTNLIKVHSAGNYFACRTQLYPRVSWVYDLSTSSLAAILVHENSVLDFDWHPVLPNLSIICSVTSHEKRLGQIYFWTGGSESSAYIRTVPHPLQKLSKHCSIRWSPRGDLLLIRDENASRIYLN